MRLKLDIDIEAAGRLADAAVTENRPLGLQAEILLRRALGLDDPRWHPPTASPLGSVEVPELATAQ